MSSPKWVDDKFIAFDFETSGVLPEYALQPWRIPNGDAYATSLVWAGGQGAERRAAIDPTRDDMAEMLQHAIDHNKTIVGWNVTFDISILLGYGLVDLVMKCKWLDGMLLWRHYFIEPEYTKAAHNRKSYSLKACVEENMFHIAGYDSGVDFHDPSPAARKKLLRYNKIDVLATYELAKMFYEKLTPRQLTVVRQEAKCLALVAQANYEGMLVNTLAARELSAKLDETAEEMLAELSPHGVTEKVIRSPQQLAELIFDQWGLEPLKLTKAGARSTDKEVLHELAFKDPRVSKLRSYREALNNKTKFATALLNSAEYNNDMRAHPLAIPFGTYSGRLTYSSKQGKGKGQRPTGFALHQTKRDKIFRELVLAPEGYTLMEFDAAGQEFRWMAEASGDKTMLALCEVGEDPHSYMGAQVQAVDYHDLMARVATGTDTEAEDIRRLGKVGNLSLQYRTSAAKLRVVARVQYYMDMQLPQAQRVYSTYRQTYPGVPQYWGDQIAQTKRDGYVETLAGRRVQVVGDWDGNFFWSMGSTAINYRIQGTGADQKYLAMACLKAYIVKHGIRFAWDMHDGIYFYVPHAMVERAAVEMKFILDNLPYKQAWGFTPRIPLPWDCKLGGSWGSLKERKYG